MIITITVREAAKTHHVASTGVHPEMKARSSLSLLTQKGIKARRPFPVESYSKDL